MRKAANIILYTTLFIVLTVLTQIGGVVLILSLFICKWWDISFRLKKFTVFISIYLLATFALVPFVAPLAGREKIHTHPRLQPANFMTVVLNRNYVSPKLQAVLQEVAENQSIRFSDANFPFINKFPLLPHLSHNDGNKVDLSFIYETLDGQPTDKTKSVSGYGVFESPKPNEFDQISVCKQQGYFQYDFPKYLTFGTKNSDLIFSESANTALIKQIVRHPSIQKVFIEPHLVTRLQLSSSKIRYHGCRAVRHDDHIHIQVR